MRKEHAQWRQWCLRSRKYDAIMAGLVDVALS